ncbi:hypothetical protein [Thiocystis violacea]|uniref:hypothetical protein n=1 Tax=Thiocystis violacea TaxID=13725 RepID=UPI00190866FE|nr:hypothetical protein [Thiocystis violacea]MBK1720481.1 hypothetical protein [Thiocystis violacea]
MAGLRDLTGFGSLVDGLVWIIGHFDNKDLAFAIALAILLMALAIWFFLHFRRHRPWVRPIRQVSARLRKLIGDTPDAHKRLSDADEIFRAEPRLEPLWREYWKHFKEDSKAGGYLNLVDPRFWFSVESLPGRSYEQWCATWAGVFLTVGLLFTFIGLSAALLKVADIGAADSVAMKAAITGILGVSSAKFITSIAGLLAYIGFSLVTRRYQSSQQAAARELADAVQHLSLPRTPEYLLYEHNEIAREQLTRMERFTDDLAVAIDGKLEKRLQMLASDFGQHLGTIKQNLPAATAEPIVAAIQSMTQAVATEFSTQVRQTAGGEINAVAEQFSAVALELAKIKDGMGGAGEAFGTDIRAAATDLRNAAEKMGREVEGRSQDLEDKIGQFSGRLDQIAGTLTQVPTTIDNALNATLSKLAESIDGITSSVGKVPARVDSALTDTLKNLTEAVDTLVDRMTEGGKNGAIALTAGGEEAGGKLKTSVGQAGQQLSDTIGGVSGKLDSIAAALGLIPDSISQTLNGTLKALTEAVDGLKDRFAQGAEEGGMALRQGGQKAGDDIKQAVGQAGSDFDRVISQTTDHLVMQLTGVLAKLEGAIQDLAGRLQTVESSLQTLPGAIADQVQNLATTGRTFEITGQTVTKAGDALRQASEPMQQTVSIIQTSLSQIRTGMSEAAATHQQTSESIQAALLGLKNTADAAQRTFAIHEERFGRADAELAKALTTLSDGVEQVAKETQSVFAEYDRHINHAVGSLSTVATELQEAAEELGDSCKQLVEARQPSARRY